VELVSPILSYREDIETLQELVRRLRKAGGFANASCGIHYAKPDGMRRKTIKGLNKAEFIVFHFT
jgi:hypothetical protein